MTKKNIIIASTLIGAGIVAYFAYKIVANWNKKVIVDKNFKIIASPDASTGIPDDDVVPIKPDESMDNEFVSSGISLDDDEFYNYWYDFIYDPAYEDDLADYLAEEFNV